MLVMIFIKSVIVEFTALGSTQMQFRKKSIFATCLIVMVGLAGASVATASEGTLQKTHTVSTGSLNTPDGVKLAWQRTTPQDPQYNLVFLPGYSESFLLYEELTRSLADRGFTVWMIDFRGMGLSGRLTDHAGIVHIDDVQTYVNDMQQFIRETIAPHVSPTKPLVLLAHSTGSLVALMLLQDKGTSQNVMRAVLSTPLLQLHTGLVPGIVVGWSASLVSMFGGSKLPVGSSTIPDIESMTFLNNRTTHDPEQHAAKIAVLKSHPEIRIATPSVGWIAAVYSAGRKALSAAQDIEIPMLTFTAGEDWFVENAPIMKFCRRAPKCVSKNFPTARHEIMRELPEIRRQWLEESTAFLKERPSSQTSP